tara:strand:- start:43 stop:255 length:213 start_codon:yes stop_codon:yes gene_type:complete
MFKAPAAPAPIATANKETTDVVKETSSGAINRPTILVNRTRDITLGFIRLKNERKLKLEMVLIFFNLTVD